MSINGYVDYQRREYCKDMQCPLQIELNALENGSEAYEEKRNICKTKCIHTTYEFHHWLIEHNYLIVRPKSIQQL